MNAFLHMPLFWIIIGALILFGLGIIILPLCQKPLRGRFYFVIVFSLIFSGTSFLLYKQWGASTPLLDKHALKQVSEDLAKITANPDIPMEEAIEKFDALEKKINYSSVALTQLASIYNQLGLFDEAMNALAKAKVLSPDVNEYQVQWIYSHSLKHQGKLEPQVRVDAESLFQKDSTQKSLLNLLAIDDYFHGRYVQSIKQWQLLLETDKDISDEKRDKIQNAILTAMRHLDTKEQAALNKNDDDVSFKVNVLLSPALAKWVSPGDVVFIYIKESEGSNMPLAVIKKMADEFPMIVNLGNKHAMVADRKLIPGMRVHVMAKVSKTGDPLDKSGELRGISDTIVIKSGNQPVEITINQRVG